MVYINNNWVRSSQISILDVSDRDNYKWVTKFTPNTTTTSIPSPSASTNISQSNQSNLGVIIGGTIGSVFVVAISVSIVLLLYRRNRKNNAKPVIPTPNDWW